MRLDVRGALPLRHRLQTHHVVGSPDARFVRRGRVQPYVGRRALLALHLAFGLLRRELLGVGVEDEGGEGAGVGVESAAGGQGGGRHRRERPEVADGGHDVAEEVCASPADFGRVRREVDMALHGERSRFIRVVDGYAVDHNPEVDLLGFINQIDYVIEWIEM